MATCYKYLDTRNKAAEKFPLKIAISHKSKRAYISTEYYLTENEWDPEKSKIKSPFKNSGSANAKVSRKYAIAEEVIDSLRPYSKELNVHQIKEAVEEKINDELKQKTAKETPKVLHAAMNSDRADSTCFYEYAKGIIKKFYTSDRGGSAGIMEDTIRSLTACTGKDRLPFNQITEEFLKEYESWYLKQYNLKGVKNTVNGLGFKTKEIRRIYNVAIKDKKTEVTQEMYPFGRYGYSIKKEKIDNKNIDPSEIAKIYDLNLTPGTKLWHHLNYFKYYFECWGMNFVDIAYLKVYQVENGRLKYRRRKTRWSNNAKKFDIEHSPIAQKIIDYYTRGKKAGDFVFPILDDLFHLNAELTDKDEEAKNKKLFEYKLANRRSNHIRRLKAISKKAGLKENVSIYVGRHSFFSIALKSGVSKSKISELAGHSNYQVTEGYLAGFSGEQLATSADMVRSAVAQHTGESDGNDMLHDQVFLLNNGKKSAVNDFLTKVWSDSSNSMKTSTDLVIEILKQTDCQDGIKAQEYVNAFLTDQEQRKVGIAS